MPLSSNDPREIERFIDSERQFISPTPVLAASLTAAVAARYPWKLAIVSDGAGNRFVAVSNGTAWRYLDGTAV